MSDITLIQEKILAFRNARNWKQFHNPKDMVLSLNLEVAELTEHFQWKDEQEFYKYLQTNKVDVADELADILYWVLVMSSDFDIDIENAVNEKLRKNEKKYPLSNSDRDREI